MSRNRAHAMLRMGTIDNPLPPFCGEKGFFVYGFIISLIVLLLSALDFSTEDVGDSVAWIVLFLPAIITYCILWFARWWISTS